MHVPGELSVGAQGKEGHAQGFTVILIAHMFYTVKNLDGVTELGEGGEEKVTGNRR